jgi:hypothetical protein
MSHIPINHHLRPLYRTAAGLVGAYALLFGIRAFFAASGLDFFQRDHLPWVMWLRANPAFAVLSIFAGVVLVIANLVGRNVDHFVNLAAGVVFNVVGLAMLALLQTDANFLGFSMVNCIVSFVFGVITLAAGLYGKAGSPEAARAEHHFTHGDTDRKVSAAS